MLFYGELSCCDSEEANLGSHHFYANSEGTAFFMCLRGSVLMLRCTSFAFLLEGFELKGCRYWHVPLALNLATLREYIHFISYYLNKLQRHLPFYSSWSYGLVGPLLRLVKYDRFQPSESLRQGFFLSEFLWVECDDKWIGSMCSWFFH